MGDKAALAGSLSFLSLADIFQILGGNASTGVLRITSQHAPDPGLIYFLKGDPIHATIGPLSGVDAVYALFGWLEGKFEFSEEEVNTTRAIKQGRMEIVLDAMRMLDDGLIKQVGPVSLEEAASGEESGAGPGKKRIVTGPLVDYSFVLNEEEYQDGEKIVKEGGHGRWIWVILRGSVTVSKETSNGTMILSYLGKGCFIGSFTALTFSEYTRSATITALGDVQLGLLDTELLYEEFASLSSDFRRVLLSLDGRLRKITNRATELFMKEDKYQGFSKDKKVIFEKGSSKKEAFSIVEGEAYVVGQTQKGYLPLVTLEENEIFGYIPFMDMGHEPQSALVLASNDLKTDSLNTDRLQKEHEHLSGTFRNMIFNECTSVIITTKLAYRFHKGE
jgi:hypothetical protein